MNNELGLRKILILTSIYPTKFTPSSGVFIESQVELLRRKGHVVHVLVCNFQKLSRKNLVELFRGLFVKSKVIPQNCTYLNLKYINLGSKIFCQPFDFVDDSKILDYDVIHAHDCVWAGYFGYLLYKKYKISYVLTSHIPLVIDDNWLNFKIKFLVLNYAKLIFTVGQNDKNILSCVFPSRKIHLLGNFIDSNIYKPKSKNLKDDYVITSVSSTSLRKNIPLFLDLIEIIKMSRNNKNDFKVKLVLAEVSDGITVDEVKILIEEKGLVNIVDVILNQSPINILDIYRYTDLYISTSGLETFGMTIAEALSMDIPTVIIKNGVSEDFVPRESGAIFLETQLEEMAERINMYIDGEIINSGSHELIKLKYGNDIFYSKLINGYNSLLQ